jgi:hypothetical protein
VGCVVALVHRSAARYPAVAAAGVLLVGAVVLVVLEGRVLEDVLILAGLVLSLAAARRVFSVHATLPVASPPSRPVLFYNPKSGGGKGSASRSLARLARAAWSRSSCTSAMTSRRSCTMRSPTALTP